MSATVSDLVEHDESLTDDATIFEESSSLPTYVVPVLMPGSELNVKIRSFNEKQQQLFNILQSWTKQHIKNKSVSYPSITEPLHIFLTGDADYHFWRKSYIRPWLKRCLMASVQ